MTTSSLQPGVPPPGRRIGANVRWYRSLFFRVILLCAILLLCLLSSVFIITRHYFREAVREMEVQASEIADSIVLEFEEKPDIDFDTLERDVRGLHKDVDIKIQPYTGEVGSATFSLERHENGHFTRVAHVPMLLGDRQVLLTARVTIAPQTEILRAFKNKYMLALTVVFILTLFLMIYFIARTLRPLTRLSESCAAISGGSLQPVSTRGAYGEVRALEDTFNEMVESLHEKELVEAKLRQAQRLSAMGNLAAGIAHDIRNPLNAIKLLSSHALDNIPDGDAAPAAKSLQIIRDEVERLEEIVSTFLSLAKETQLRLEPHGVDSLLEECLRLFRKDAEDRGIRLTSDLRAGDRKLMLDPKHFTRAVLNVLVNALEACPQGGRVRLLSRLTDRACEIEIRDDGPGLPKETAERAFEPYYTTKPGGTGLGLSITRGIIEEHGGRIELYSPPSQGCQVLISLPLEKAKL